MLHLLGERGNLGRELCRQLILRLLVLYARIGQLRI